MWYLSIVIPDIAVAIVQRPQPRETWAPLLLWTIDRGRAMVTAVAPSLASLVRVGMSVREAQTIAPHATLLSADTSCDVAVVAQIVACASAQTPRVEVVSSSPDVHLDLELGPTSAATAMDMATCVMSDIKRQTGLAAQLGLAPQRFAAHQAARRADGEIPRLVSEPAVADYLAAVPLTVFVSDGLIVTRLADFGITTLGQFSALPRDAVQAQFGARGAALHRLAGGEDERRVQRAHDLDTITVGWRFKGGVHDRSVLAAVLPVLSETLSKRLQARALGTQAVQMQLLSDDAPPSVVDRATPHTTTQAQVLLPLLRGMLDSVSAPAPVERLMVIAHDLNPLQVEQQRLFPETTHTKTHVLAEIQQRYRHLLFRAHVVNEQACVPAEQVRFSLRDAL